MTKNLLLAAGAVAALAFAGAANAGTISTATRTIASEAALPTGGFAGAASATTVMTNPVSIPAGTTATYTVKYTITGATFDGAPAIVSTGAAAVTAQSGTVYIQADGSAIAIIEVDNASGAAADLTGFTLTGNIEVPAKATVRIGSEVSVVNGGLTLPIDTAAPKAIVDFKPLIAGFTAVADSAEAQLPDYVTFAAGATGATLATDIEVSVNTGTFYAGLTGAAVTAADIIDGLTATVSGPAGAQLDVLSPELGATAAEAEATDVEAVFEMTAGDVGDILDGTGISFTIDNADEATLNGVSYSLTLEPEYATGFSAAAEFGPYAVGEVTLEGTNFVAPWFTLNNANNTATLRLANQGTAATGPVFVTLKAANAGDVSDAARVQISEGIAAGGVLEVTGSTLAALLGTSAQNGDLQVTVQGDGTVISGKVRVRNVSGATFETSLGNLN